MAFSPHPFHGHQREESTADAADAVATMQSAQGVIHESLIHTEMTSALLPSGPLHVATETHHEEMATATPHELEDAPSQVGTSGSAPPILEKKLIRCEECAFTTKW